MCSLNVSLFWLIIELSKIAVFRRQVMFVLCLLNILCVWTHNFWNPLHYQSSTVKLKLSICWIKYHTKKVYGKLEIQLHTLLSLALDGGEWSPKCPGCFTPEESTGRIWGSVGSRASLDIVVRITSALIEIKSWFHVCPAQVEASIVMD